MSKGLHLRKTRRSLVVPMLFDALEPGLKQDLIAASPVRTYRDGQFIQHRGTRADGFWVIDQGLVRVGMYMAEGEFRAVADLGPGDSYGELAVFSQRPRVVDAVSGGVSAVRFIAAAPFLDALAQYPASNRAMLGALAGQLQDTLDHLAGMRQGSNRARLAGLLANLSATGSEVRVTQQELAEFLGVTRATANAALKSLENEGFIERLYGSVRIVDRQALRLFSLG